MNKSRRYTNSFTIETRESKTANPLLNEIGRVMYEWASKKEIEYGHFLSNLVPPSYPKLFDFFGKSHWAWAGNPQMIRSSFTTVSGRLQSGSDAWGLRYKHDDTRETGASIIAEVIARLIGRNGAVCTCSLYSESKEYLPLSPPRFTEDLWRLGKCYNTRCYSYKHYSLVQCGLSHFIGDSIQTIPHDQLAAFLASKDRKIPVVVVPETDWQKSNSRTKSQIHGIAGRLAGCAEFVFLDNKHINVRVHRPGEGYVKPSLVRSFREMDWKRLENDLVGEYDHLPPLEEDAIDSFDQLVNELEPIADVSVEPPIEDTLLLPSLDQLKISVAELVSRLDELNHFEHRMS